MNDGPDQLYYNGKPLEEMSVEEVNEAMHMLITRLNQLIDGKEMNSE